MNIKQVFVLSISIYLALSYGAKTSYALVIREEVREQIQENIQEIKATGVKIAISPGVIQKWLGKKGVVNQGVLDALSGSSFGALTLTVSKDGKSYTVKTDVNTKFTRRYWGAIGSVSEMQIGDKLMVVGTWQDDAKTTLLAKMIRDASIQLRHGVFFGVVTEVTSTGYTIQAKRGIETVTVSANTKIVNRKEEAIDTSAILVGHRIRVKGLWNNKNSTVTEVSHVKDFDLPVRPIGTVAPTAATE